jgi:pimeloyl-ACP methyl ester carboxylesterase
MTIRGIGVLSVLFAATFAAPAWGSTGPFAPTDRPGPPLDVPPAELRAALHCDVSVAHATVEPVLLSPGTGFTGDGQYGGNWEPALTELHIPWCSISPPHYTLGDIQVAGEYLVYAIRAMSQLSGRRIAILGHSQGGMSMRWALRFWPDTRGMVDDVIGLAGDNHGSKWQAAENAIACVRACPPVNYQQAEGSNFLQALNSSAETFAGVSYTEIYTYVDEIVDNTPPYCSSCLTTGQGAITNVAIQDVCPDDVAEHLKIATDLLAYNLALDALTPSGPADPARIPRTVCAQLYTPGENPLTAQPPTPQGPNAATAVLPVILGSAGDTVGAPETTSEPPLACYVFANCPRGAPPAVTSAPPRRRSCRSRAKGTQRNRRNRCQRRRHEHHRHAATRRSAR